MRPYDTKLEVNRYVTQLQRATSGRTKTKYPDFDITHIVLGSDAFNEIKLWKNGSELLRNYKFIIISRLSSDIEPMSNIKIIESLSDISSSDIREKISENISVLHYTPIEIHNYIKENNLYR